MSAYDGSISEEKEQEAAFLQLVNGGK